MHSLVFSTTLDEYISSFPALYNISLPYSTTINTSLFIIGFVLGDPAYRVRSLGSLSHMAVGLINTLLWVWIGTMCDMSRGGSLTTQRLAPSGGSGSFGGGVVVVVVVLVKVLEVVVVLVSMSQLKLDNG
jgi:hypothetical protein